MNKLFPLSAVGLAICINAHADSSCSFVFDFTPTTSSSVVINVNNLYLSTNQAIILSNAPSQGAIAIECSPFPYTISATGVSFGQTIGNCQFPVPVVINQPNTSRSISYPGLFIPVNPGGSCT